MSTVITAGLKVDVFKKTLFEKGLSINDLAKKSDLSGMLLRKYISEEVKISPKSAKKILDALEMNFDDLFYFED